MAIEHCELRAAVRLSGIDPLCRYARVPAKNSLLELTAKHRH